jgi:hypothetical protein
VVCANSYDLVANRYLFLAPLFASRSACSFPSMFVCALTLDIVVSCVRFFSISTIEVSMDLSAWLLCWVGCFIWVFYMCVLQSVNMWAGSFMYLVVTSLSVLCMAISSALKHVCSPDSLLDICTSIFVGL